MADKQDRGENGRAASPREDFNPLYEACGVDVTSSLSEEGCDVNEDSPYSSVDIDRDLPDEYYGKTPPVTGRQLKRYKEKSRTQWNKTDRKELNRNLVVTKLGKKELPGKKIVLKQDLYEDEDELDSFHLYGESHGGFSGVNLHKPVSRTASAGADYKIIKPIVRTGSFGSFSKKRRERDSAKNFKTSRAYDRDYKRSATDLTDMFQTQHAIQIDTPNRFLSLNSKPVHIEPQEPYSLQIPRRQSLHNLHLECPPDRLEFFKVFSMLINMGNNVSREKDSKLAPYNRQLSSEQELYQNKLNDLLWLELQAWLNGRSMHEQDLFVRKARDEHVAEVLQEILDFKVEYNDLDTGQGDVCSPIKIIVEEDHENGVNSIVEDEEESENEDEECNILCGNSPHCRMMLHRTVAKQKEALIQVTRLLQKLECMEQLYPTSKAMGREFPMYAEETFKHRMQALCLWLNITKDIGHKLKLMAKVLHVDSLEKVQWPWLDYDNTLITRLASESVDLPADVYTAEGFDSDLDSENGGHSGYEDDDEEDPDEDDYDDDEDDDGEDDENVQGDNDMHRTDNFAYISRINNKNVRFVLGSPEGGSSLSTSPTVDLAAQMASPPSDMSTPAKQPVRTVSMSSSISRTLSEMSLDSFPTAMYRYFVDRNLKKMGMSKLKKRIQGLLRGTVTRGRQVLEKIKRDMQNESVSQPDSENQTPIQSPSSTHIDLTKSALLSQNSDPHLKDSTYEGNWYREFSQMGLPSFKPTYLFLIRIPLDVIHECLRIRLEQRPVNDPSLLSIRQLLCECKEVLTGAVFVKKFYKQCVLSVLCHHDSNEVEGELELFDEDMRRMLEVYFDYLQTWMCELQNLPEASRSLKNVLESEWEWTKKISLHIRGGEAESGKRFCLMASSLLHSIADFLETGIDECINQLYDSTTADSTPLSLTDLELENNCCRPERCYELRQAIIQTCRHFKVHLHEARERSSKAVGFAKMLRKDLEIAADFNVAVGYTELLQRLKDTSHIRVIAPHSTGYLMFIPDRISEDQIQILQLLNVTCGREDKSEENKEKETGYLLLVKCEGCAEPDREAWDGNSLYVEPTAETTIALSHIEVEGLLLTVIHSSHLATERQHFAKLMGSAVEMVNEQTSCHQAIAESLDDLKLSAMELREKLVNAIRQVDEKLNLEDIPDSELDEVEKINIQKLYRQTLHQCYNFGFEYHKEVARLISGEMRNTFRQLMPVFAKQWMKFVIEKCERGRGMRPRWATQGLDFLIEACEPGTLALLTDQEYQNLKSTINNCISHVVGDKTTPGSPGSGTPGFRMSSPDLSVQRYLRNLSWPERDTSRLHKHQANKSYSEPNTPYTYPNEEGQQQGMQTNTAPDKSGEQRYSLRKSVMSKIRKLEEKRNNDLQDKKRIGRVTAQRTEVDYHINVRKVNFKWQRGIKIGEGQFGKVYTAINLETGEFMAMKELRFQPNDHKAVKDVADEIKTFELISHESLVKYYGTEVHKDEMLIFMEYCDEGTLEEAARDVGLTEPIVRKYTSEILVAINVLHEHGIVHRDIKGANIFLTSHGPLKLGDFGCSIALKNHTTMPGEVNNLVGTTAFMAPEVITKNGRDGHGRAADIWSLGCVVIEMVAGKRPWHELENNYQIMFKVGIGNTPAIPDSLSEEGHDFLSHCFLNDSRLRWTASQLLDHPFTKFYSEDEEEKSSPPDSSVPHGHYS